MKVNVWMTATRVVGGDSGAADDHTEEHGWIDWSWSHHELYDSRNDVRPVVSWDDGDPDDVEDHATVDDFIRATVAEYLGAADDNGDGTWYGQDEHTCDVTLRDGSSWTYALHFTHKTYDGVRGWHEVDVTYDRRAGI